MTDLEAHVNAEGRAELVKQVREKIDELGITYVYYQFVSVTGRIVGKGIPTDHWERIAERGFQLVYGSTANLFVDRHGDYIGYGPESSELVGIADPETFCQLPWDKRVARVFCTLFRNREERVNPGGHLTSDCRGNLRILHNEFQDKHGLDLRVGTEPEMMWLKRGEDGKPNGGVTKPNCYHIDQFEELRPVFMKVIEYSQAMGLDIIQGDHEDAPGQLELNTMFDDVLRNADRLTTYRQICAQVAREHNLIACFMSKPFMGVSASGCHHNMSLWRGGEDKVNDLHFSPETLFLALQPFSDPFEFYHTSVELKQLREGFRSDMFLAEEILPLRQSPAGRIYQFPNVAWCRRVSGVFSNQVAREAPHLAHAILVERPGGAFLVGVRAPIANPQGAEKLCLKFSGGGRSAAAGINHLAPEDVERFFADFEKQFAN